MHYVKENTPGQKRADKRAATLKAKAHLTTRVRACKIHRTTYSSSPTTYKRNSTKLCFFNSKRACKQELGYLIH